MELTEQLKEIKTQLRLSMNGAVSQSMREKGLVYKLNFGVELPVSRALLPLTRKTTLWRRHFGKKIFANVKYWRDCSSRLTVSCPKLRIYGWRTFGILRLRSLLV